MIEWTETLAILERATELAAAGRRAAVATVVRVLGSAYRRPGARFLVDDAGETLGSVSGGCLEADVREVARQVMAGEEPRLLHYDTGASDEVPWGLGLGCDGSVDVFVQPVAPDLPGGSRFLELLSGDLPFVAGFVVAGEEALGSVAFWTGDEAARGEIAERALARLAEGRSALEPVGEALVFLQVFEPPPELLICGAGDDAMPLARYAGEAGFRVAVVDHRQAFLEPGRFPTVRRRLLARAPDGVADLGITDATYAVIMTHSLEGDRRWLEALAGTAAPYIGLLGPRARTAELLQDVPEEVLSRVHGPVGLDLGADGPTQVALSILSEVLSVRSGRRAASLRERQEAIHADPA